jgi:hypothetical protein
MWVLHLQLILHLNLQYPHLYFYQLEFLGFSCNTHIHTYIYQLGFWGLIGIPKLVLTSTNWDFEASLEYLNSYLPLPTKILGLHWNT